MAVLNRNLVGSLSDSNKEYLRDQGFIVGDNGADIDLGDDKNQIINQLIENEKHIAGSREEIYQKEKNKEKYIIQFMIAAFIFLGAGFALAPLFILSTIVLPILPVLLFGFGIIAITKFCLNIKINHQETSVRNARNILASLEKVEKKLSQEGLSEKMKNITEVIVDLGQQNTIQYSDVSNLLRSGVFNENIPREDPANQLTKVDEHISSGPSN